MQGKGVDGRVGEGVMGDGWLTVGSDYSQLYKEIINCMNEYFTAVVNCMKSQLIRTRND